MMMVRRRLLGWLVLMVCILGGGPVAQAGQYIESVVWNSREAILSQNALTLNVSVNNGPGAYNYKVFYSECGSGTTRGLSYVIVPSSITLGGGQFPIHWSGNVLADINGDWVVIGDYFSTSGQCNTVGKAGSLSSSISIATNGVGSLQELLPGDYPFSLTYYVGQSFSTSDAGALNIAKTHGLQGDSASTPTYDFTGVAACAQDSLTSGATIDFGTVTSNGTVQSGPLTTLGLVCNYDLALNDVTYSLTSNNPVSGEPSTGQNVAVALTNGATVTLDGGNVTQPDPKRVSVNITPSIDTRGAIAGEGTGSATLTFNYE